MSYELTVNAQRQSVMGALGVGLPSLAACGDSLIAGVDTGGLGSLYSQLILRGGLKFKDLGNNGVGGTRTDQIASQVPTAVASGAKKIIINGGVNDISQSIALATINANTISNLAAIISGGATPIDVGCPPTNTPGNVANYVRLNLWRKLYCYKNDIQHLDIWPLLATSAGAYTSGLNLDAVHYNIAGSVLCADALSAMLMAVPQYAPPLLAYTDTASDHDSWIGNAVSMGTVGATTVPSGWFTYGSGGAYEVIAADAGDFGNWLRCTISAGTAVGFSETAVSISSLGWSVGDKIGIGFNLRIGGAAGALQVTSAVVGTPSIFNLTAVDTDPIRVYSETTIPSGTVNINFRVSGTGTGYFEVQRPMVVNLTLLGLA